VLLNTSRTAVAKIFGLEKSSPEALLAASRQLRKPAYSMLGMAHKWVNLKIYKVNLI